MKSINIVECKNENDLKEVAILAEKIWHEFFPGIISEAQIASEPTTRNTKRIPEKSNAEERIPTL